MLKRTENNRFWAGVPPWILIGAVAVLFPIFAFMTIENIHRYKKNSIQMLMEKGAALIRSFEAGARTGMGMQWSGRQLQNLLTETAQQPDIAYLLVTDDKGIILAHNDPSQIGKIHETRLPSEAPPSETVTGRVLTPTGGQKIFEVFRVFAPSKTHTTGHQYRFIIRGWLKACIACRQDTVPTRLSIYVGLDMSSIDAARKSDTHHTIVMGLFLLFIGFAGIMLLFLAQGYRAASTSLSRIKAFSDNLVENMPIGLFAIDQHNKIASFNQVAETILSLSWDDAIRKDAQEVLPCELWAQIEQVNGEQEIVEKEIDCSVNGGKIVSLGVSASRLHDDKGTFLGYVMLFKDLSEVQSLRKEIARSQRLASVGSLAAGVAHEIRNPLSSIKGFATYFKERHHDVAEDQQIADIMVQEVDRLNRVIGQLLELARPVTISGKALRIRSFLEDSLKLVERQAEEKNIRIRTRFSSRVEEVFVDQDRMNQVLLNLYLNALDAMEDGGTLNVGLSSNGKKQIDISISDTGAGIRQEDLSHIFDPYFTTKSSGTGLGLAIVHNILEAHKGKIRVDSLPEQGTTVTVSLPYSEECKAKANGE